MSLFKIALTVNRAKRRPSTGRYTVGQSAGLGRGRTTRIGRRTSQAKRRPAASGPSLRRLRRFL